MIRVQTIFQIEVVSLAKSTGTRHLKNVLPFSHRTQSKSEGEVIHWVDSDDFLLNCDASSSNVRAKTERRSDLELLTLLIMMNEFN